MSQPEALRLADLCSTAKTAIYRADAEQAAAELRRLHAENEALRAELAKPVESDAELEQIQSIYNDYKKPDSQIDKGNLYWALGKCLECMDVALVESRYRARLLAGAGEPVGWVSMGQIRFTKPTVDLETYTPAYSADAIAAAVLAEREACAMAVQQMDCAHRCGVGGEVAVAIRARSQS